LLHAGFDYSDQLMGKPARPAVWSHRGRLDRDDAFTENTVAAFEAASAAGVDGIELDAWRTLDGAWVVQHDQHCSAGPLDLITRADVPEPIPELADALAACRVGTINVELKVPPEASPAQAHRLGEEIAAVLADLSSGGSVGDLVLSSFSTDAAEAALFSAPDLRVSLLVEKGAPHVGLSSVARASYWGIHLLHSVLGAADVAELHRDGLKVAAWTVDEPSEVQRLAAAGADVLICNEALLALEILSR
jgi:glycerophosphoryl diester phosphodiesterase